MPHTQLMSRQMVECIQECVTCYTTCLETTQHCLMLGGRHADPHHIGLLNNCAKICETSASFMLTGSEFHAAMCGVCAQVCDACGESCAQIAAGDESMQRCVDTCRRCAESCRSMARH